MELPQAASQWQVVLVVAPGLVPEILDLAPSDPLGLGQEVHQGQDMHHQLLLDQEEVPDLPVHSPGTQLHPLDKHTKTPKEEVQQQPLQQAAESLPQLQDHTHIITDRIRQNRSQRRKTLRREIRNQEIKIERRVVQILSR